MVQNYSVAGKADFRSRSKQATWKWSSSARLKKMGRRPASFCDRVGKQEQSGNQSDYDCSCLKFNDEYMYTLFEAHIYSRVFQTYLSLRGFVEVIQVVFPQTALSSPIGSLRDGTQRNSYQAFRHYHTANWNKAHHLSLSQYHQAYYHGVLFFQEDEVDKSTDP